MYKIVLLVLLMGLEAAANAEGLKVGYVDVPRVLKAVDESESAQKVRKRLEEEFKSRDTDLVAKQKQLKELEQKLAKDGATMGEEDRQRLEKDIVVRSRKLKNDRDSFREDFNLRRNEESSKMRKTILETIREYAKSGNYDLILTDGVVYYSDRTDITDKVLERLK